MSRIDKNIRTLRKFRNLSQEVLSEALDIQRARLASYEEGRAEPPYDLLIRIADYFHVAIDALLRGDLSKTDPTDLMKIGENRILFPIMVDKDGNNMVELVPVKAQAGYLNGYADPEYIESLQHMNFPFLPVGKHRAFPIKGDSMPPLVDGSFVIGKYLESLREIKDGQTYILITRDEGIVYKRVYNNMKEDGTLSLHSDNKVYEPYKVKGEDILEIWEYQCAINTSKNRPEELNLESIMGMLRELKIEFERIKK
ncbi:MAG TPA: LexA family transcriptional regulator [Bacteroidia bacterium]|jgi:transcriptional regulator with XRE-family HTH domain|nr:LexA family transcriptional regulator [Bacteroidia bacterium]